MGAEEVIRILHKKQELTTPEIAKLLEISTGAVKRIVRNLAKIGDLDYRELTEEEKEERYGKRINVSVRIYRVKLN